jgi:enamine deaminase RidA (YjgF/YER057c/UK114 family)
MMADETIEAKLNRMGLVLPQAVKLAPGAKLPYAPVRVIGDRAYLSGHGPTNPDGSLALPLGRLGGGLSIEQGYAAARLVALAMLGSLKRELGDLERVKAWIKVLGMVNCVEGFDKQPQVINGFSELILELYGPERGAHARSAVGMIGLPSNIPVEIEAEVLIG